MRELFGSGELGVVSQPDQITAQLTATADGTSPDFDLSASVAILADHSLLLLPSRMRPALKSSAFGEGRLMQVWASASRSCTFRGSVWLCIVPLLMS